MGRRPFGYEVFTSIYLLIVQVPLLAMLEEYTLLRKEKEEEKYKQRVTLTLLIKRENQNDDSRNNEERENISADD